MRHLIAILIGLALSTTTRFAQTAWQHAHGDSANTSFEPVNTAPATTPNNLQPLGSIAPGANPVVGPNGDVYVANLEGELRAFHGDGRPYWTRKINALQGGFFAAPVVGADGSIYVVSSVHYTDYRNGITNRRNDSYLHKFSPGGAWVYWRAFPEQFPASPTVVNRGATTAPPNIWRWNGSEVIMVPVLYKSPVAQDLHLVAFAVNGAVLADRLVTQGQSPETSGGSGLWNAIAGFFEDCFVNGLFLLDGCAFAPSFDPDLPLPTAGFPLPGVAIRPDPLGGSPLIMMTDARHDKVVYNFSPQGGFFPVARSSHLLRQFTTPPVALPNDDTLIGTLDGYLTRTRADFSHNWIARGLGTLTAAPTRLADGSLVVLSRGGIMTVVASHRSAILLGDTIASAAASCNHFFVSTAFAFDTFDAKIRAHVGSFPWIGGGLHAPVVGLYGEVYAIASNTLYVFPAPSRPSPGMPPPLSCILAPPTPG